MTTEPAVGGERCAIDDVPNRAVGPINNGGVVGNARTIKSVNSLP